MKLNVRELLKMDTLKGAEMITGIEGMDRTISGVTITEAPDIADWIKGGELLLTSLYSISNFNADEQQQLVEKLAEKKVGALAIKKRQELDEIPKIMVDAGDKFGLPIIQLPKEIPFTDIMYPVMATLFNKQVKILNYYKEVHEQFTALALANGGVEEIIISLKNLIGNPIALYDKNFHCITSTDSRVNTFTVLDKSSNRKKHEKIKFSYYRQRVAFPDMDGSQEDQIVFPIETINNIKTYLVASEINRSLEELDFIAIENASTIICLELLKQFAISEVERKFKNDLIDDLITGKASSINTVYQRANLMGWDLNQFYAVVVFDINDFPQSFSKTNYKKCDKSINKIYTLLYETVNLFVPNDIVRSGSNQIVVLWRTDKKQDKNWVNSIKKTAKIIQEQIKKQSRNLNVAVGIGNVAKDIMCIATSYQEAQDALDFGRTIYGEEAITAFGDLGVYKLLCNYPNPSQLVNYIPLSLQKLMKYDQSNKNEFLKTVEVFLNCNRNATKAAKVLFIHYKTIIYRLERIKEITEVDWDNSEEMLELQMGMKILKLINKRR